MTNETPNFNDPLENIDAVRSGMTRSEHDRIEELVEHDGFSYPQAERLVLGPDLATKLASERLATEGDTTSAPAPAQVQAEEIAEAATSDEILPPPEDKVRFKPDFTGLNAREALGADEPAPVHIPTKADIAYGSQKKRKSGQ